MVSTLGSRKGKRQAVDPTRYACKESIHMSNQVLIEICVESLALAVAAEAGGADRVELCQDLSCGGVTPSAELMRAVRGKMRIPVHALIRPRAGDFCYSGCEFETMQREIAMAKHIGLDGIVLGVLDPSARVDRERTSMLVESALPLPVTFHRAFDECPDLAVALEAVIESGATRILTSGGNPSAVEGVPRVSQLVKAAQGRIVIMPGGGIRAANVELILRNTGAREIHTSLGGWRQSSDDKAADRKISPDLPATLFEATVRTFKARAESAFV